MTRSKPARVMTLSRHALHSTPFKTPTAIPPYILCMPIARHKDSYDTLQMCITITRHKQSCTRSHAHASSNQQHTLATPNCQYTLGTYNCHQSRSSSPLPTPLPHPLSGPPLSHLARRYGLFQTHTHPHRRLTQVMGLSFLKSLRARARALYHSHVHTYTDRQS